MKVGQILKILESGKDYFGPRYANTEVELIKIYPDGGTLEVRCFDGRECITPRSFVEPLDIPEIPGIIANSESNYKCLHSNKRWTVISRTLTYMYCPDCKKEVS